MAVAHLPLEGKATSARPPHSGSAQLRRPDGGRPRTGWASVAVCLLLAGCVAGTQSSGDTGPEGPPTSATGEVYPPGSPPEPTRYSETATLFLQRDRLERALELAMEGVEADPENAVHHYLAGVAHARLGNNRKADRFFDEAERIYPAYELDTEPERLNSWAEAFNRGVEAYTTGDVETAFAAWSGAVAIYNLRPEAHRNLASALTAEGRYEEAIEVYQQAVEGLEDRPATRALTDEEIRERERIRVEMEERLGELLLFRERYAEAEPLIRRQLQQDSGQVRLRRQLGRALAGQGKTEEAGEIYSSLLSEQSLEGAELSDVGVALFQAGRHAQAAEAFDRLTRLQPNSRDAWFNYANALLASGSWQKLTSVGDRLLEVDPLNEDAALIVARAYLESGDEPGAARRIERSEAEPVHLEALQMRPSRSETTIQARVVGNRAEPGTPIRLRFTFYTGGETAGAETVTVPAPASDESTAIEVSIDRRATSYRYEVVERADASR